MGAPSVAHDDHSSGNVDGFRSQFRQRWFSFKSVVLILVTLLLTATAICVLHQVNEPRDEQQPADLGSLLDGLVLPMLNSAVTNSSQHEAPSNGWLLFDKTATDSRPARSANEASRTKLAREPTNGFKWVTGAILDDFALGMGPEDFESNDQIANNNYTQCESSSDSREQLTTAKAVTQAEQEAHKETLDLVAQNSSGANKVLHNRWANVINDSNIKYSKTRQDLRDGRAKLEQQQLVIMTALEANQNTSLPVTPPLQTPAPRNVSLFNSDSNSTNSDAGLTLASNLLNSKTNETSFPSKSPATLGLEEHKRHSSAAKMRHKRRAGIFESERGKPILNEFSFPANLVQGMRFVLMCQVLDGEPPIQIKWFKDSQDLEQLLQNSRANQDNHQQQQQTGPDEIGPAASKLISLVSASSGDVSSSSDSSTGAGQQQQQNLEHIEMISNDELGSSLLFRKVKQQHGGNYTCLASNRHGASSYTSLMTVKVPPSWRVEPRDRESIMGEQITIDCQAVGNPNPFLRWKFATSVQHDKTPSDPSALQTPASILAANHQATSALGSSTTANQHLQQQHLHSFKLINSNHHVQTLENGSLIIRQAGKEHEGLYLCEADNGVEPSLVKQIKLIVHKQAHFLDDIQILVQPSSGQQDQHQQQQGVDPSKGLSQKDASLSLLQQFNQLTPSIKVASLPQNTSLVRLVCSPYGDVPIQLDWLKDGHLIHTHSAGGANLQGGTNSGLESGRDSSASSALLEPTSTNSRYHVSSRWSTHRSLSAGSSGLESELLLADLGRHDAGLYTCSARNAFGQSERKLRLIVQEQPEAPTMVDVARISSRSISLRWLAPFDGNSPITKYVIEYKKQPGSTISQHSTGDNQPMSRSEKKMSVVATSKTSSDTNLAFMVDSSFSEKATITGLRQQMVGDIQLSESVLGDRAQIQHTVHDLEPMTTYTMRVMAVNALGQSRPSVALSLRTEEEVPATVPDMVEAIVLSSSSIKLRWTISYSYEHELIDGFFIGYRSFDSSALLVDSASVNGNDQSLATNTIQDSGSGGRSTAKQMIERPTFTYKTIRLINQHQAQQQPLDETGQSAGGGVNDPQAQSSSSAPLPSQQGSDATPVVAPISSVTKTMPINSILMAGGASKQFVSPTNLPGNSVGGQQIKPNQLQQGEMALVVVSNFEFVINGLERNTEYTILIQCFNKKGTGPSSDPVVTKTLQHDPPQKLTLVANDLTETSLRLNWHFPGEMKNLMAASNQQDYVQHPSVALSGRSGQGLMELVDGFVLTFAKIAQPTGNLSRQNSNGNGKRQQDFSSKSLPHYHPQHSPSHGYKQQQQQRTQQNQQADSAARISKQQNSPTNNNFQYNPPIQPSQLLDHQWQAIQLAPHQREHVLKSLECGTWYAMKIWAFNKVGKGEASDLVTVNTRGKSPLAPSRSAFLSANSTQVKLNLNSWYDGGCEIEKFIVQYRARGQQEWILVSNNILKEQSELTIRDLSPATAYELLIGAQNHVNLSEAKYRFTTLDSDGKQVVPSKTSFLPALNDDYNDESNSMIDYSDDSQYSSSGSNIRRESMGSGFGFSHSPPGDQQWLLMASHVLNSPLTLLFTFCIFLILLGLLAFNRFNGNTEHRHYNNGNSLSGKTTRECNDGAIGGSNLVRRCSIDEMATMLDGNSSGPPMSCTTKRSSTASTESPGRMVNVHAASSGRMNSSHPVGPTYAPPDCYGSNAYCSAGVQQSSVGYGSLTTQANNLSNLNPDIGNGHQHGQRPPGGSWSGANTIDNYSPDQQHHNQHAVGFYSALPTANYSVDAAPLNQTTAPRSASTDHDCNHQHLMQMLLIPPQQQQHQQSSQMNEDYTPSMTTMALTTLARQKAGLLKGPNGVTEYNNSLFQHGPSFTLGRVPAQNQECFHTANCKSNNDEHYQMNIIDTLTRKRKALLRLDRRQQDPTDLYHDTSSTNLSSSFTSTSGCGTATASTSQSGGAGGDT